MVPGENFVHNVLVALEPEVDSRGPVIVSAMQAWLPCKAGEAKKADVIAGQIAAAAGGEGAGPFLAFGHNLHHNVFLKSDKCGAAESLYILQDNLRTLKQQLLLQICMRDQCANLGY